MAIKIFGPDSEAFNTYASTGLGTGGNKAYPFGTALELQDGRLYRFAQAGATTLTIGTMQQGPANVANDQGRAGIVAGSAVGSRSIPITTGGAVVANLYAEGYITSSVPNAAASDAGQVYPVDNHLAGTTATLYNLAAGHAIRVAAADTTTRFNLIGNPYKGVIKTIATTPTAGPVGVAVSAATGSATVPQFCWLQRRGIAAVLTEATTALVAGASASATFVTAGAIGAPLADATKGWLNNTPQIGFVILAAATGAWGTICLQMD